MSNTFKTNRARAANKEKHDHLNPDLSQINSHEFLEKRLELATSGERHGNNRKYLAKKKVLERRAERHQSSKFEDAE